MPGPEFDFLVFIGRFQPFHRGHEAVVRAALESAAHVVVVVGSARRPRSLRNPWSFAEREAMVRGVLDEQQNRRVHVVPIVDAMYNEDLWISTVQRSVRDVVAEHHDASAAPRIGLVGCSKSNSGYYVDRFPRWSAMNVDDVDGHCSSTVRDGFFPSPDIALLYQALPLAVINLLRAFVSQPEYAELCAEADYVRDYRAQWSAAPYPPILVTVDAVVVQSGQVLLVERKGPPGVGQWALPGGFVDQHEHLETAMLRELVEETNIGVALSALTAAVAGREVFDEPCRSARGRTITHAFLVRLEPGRTLPQVRGGDDARHAFWQPLSDLDPERCFEDHYFIIQKMLGAPR